MDPKRKNISFRIDSGRLTGVASPNDAPIVTALLQRYHRHVMDWLQRLLPHYSGHLSEPVNTLRVHAVDAWQQASSWRQDDRRLHVDAFPSRPVHGQRILRFFTNIHPEGEPRRWRVGEPFPDMAQRLLPRARRYSPTWSRLQQSLRITKSRRSHYDHLMLELHDAMKADASYQQDSPQWTVDFPPGSSWVCYSDQVAHAAVSGQYMLEQTLMVDFAGLKLPQQAPLKVLESLTGTRLV